MSETNEISHWSDVLVEALVAIMLLVEAFVVSTHCPIITMKHVFHKHGVHSHAHFHLLVVHVVAATEAPDLGDVILQFFWVLSPPSDVLLPHL